MVSDKALLFKQSPAKVRFHSLLAHEMPLSQGGVARWAGNPSGVPAIFFLIFRPEMRQKMKQPSAYPLGGHADGCALHQSFHSIFGAVVVCHFRICNPIFHTPFLHHFGVEQYRIT